MTVRCKLKCIKAEPAHPGSTDQHFAEFDGVSDDSPENKAFFNATPSASVTLGIMNKQHFKVGEEYFFDITPARPVGQAAPE